MSERADDGCLASDHALGEHTPARPAEVVHAIGTVPVDHVSITDDMLRRMLRDWIKARHPSVGPYHDILDALVSEKGHRRIEARKRCVELWNALHHQDPRPARPEPTSIPGPGEGRR